MRALIILILNFVFLNAGLLDFLDIKRINKSYKNGEYADTIKYLYSLDKEGAVINYDLATAYYKVKDYKNALKLYKRALGEGVSEFDRLYNIGNCYFNLKEYKNAIYAYKKALELKKDKDALFNLKLSEYKLNHKNLEKVVKPKNLNKKIKKRKHSKIKNKKFTKKELEKLKKKLKEEKLKKEMKKLIKKSFQNRDIPILMYKLED